MYTRAKLHIPITKHTSFENIVTSQFFFPLFFFIIILFYSLLYRNPITLGDPDTPHMYKSRHLSQFILEYLCYLRKSSHDDYGSFSVFFFSDQGSNTFFIVLPSRVSMRLSTCFTFIE